MHKYGIRITGIKDGNHKYSFKICEEFFESYVNSDILNASIKSNVTLNKRQEKIKLKIKISGHVNLLCDLCIDPLKVKIENEINLIIEIGNKSMESNDDIIYVKNNQNEVNIENLIYEAIMLSIPNQRKHSGKDSDKCNIEMLELTNKYLYQRNNKIDPRWEKLKDLK